MTASIDPVQPPCEEMNASLYAADMGTDGTLAAKDAFGYTLHYYHEGNAMDYMPIGIAQNHLPIPETGFVFHSLYNGNIGGMTVNLPRLGGSLIFTYRYDQLNRLVQQDTWKGIDPVANTWRVAGVQSYREAISYDPNGNIMTYKRNGDAARSNAAIKGMDDLVYHYAPHTNQLDYVAESAPDALPEEYEKYRDIKQGQTSGNYQYDAIGNLTKDVSEGITNIEWNVYGKIKSISKTDGTSIAYSYDATGNRISKTVNGKSTYYVRDAQGNILSIYAKEDTLKQTEINLYGSSRLGIYHVEKNVQSTLAPPPEKTIFTTGNKFFELSNHLGNVLATISDNKRQHSSNGTDVDFYTADVLSAQNYYPFGMQMMGLPGGLVEEPVVPPVVLEEEDYTTGTGGWASYNAATVTNDNGRVKVSTDIVWGIAQKELNLVQGKRYRVRFSLDMGNCKMLSVIMWDPITQTYVRMSGSGSALSSGGSYEGTFEAEAARTLFLFEVVPGYGNPVPDSTAYFWIDNFSIEEYTPMYDVVPRNYWTAIREDEGRLKVVSKRPWGEASKMLHLEAGKKYRLRYTVDLGNLDPMHVIIYNPADGSYTYPAETGLGFHDSGEKMGTFTAAADELELRFQMPQIPTGADSVYCWLDNIYLEEVVEVEGGGGVNGGGYRFGFNGKENDTETGYQDYGMRIYKPQLGRFLSVDPLSKSYPYYTPYSFAGNKPIRFIDLDGAEESKHWFEYDARDLIMWMQDPSNPIKDEGFLHKAATSVNRTFNPLYNAAALIFGEKSLGPSSDNGVMSRSDAAFNLTTQWMFWKYARMGSTSYGPAQMEKKAASNSMTVASKPAMQSTALEVNNEEKQRIIAYVKQQVSSGTPIKRLAVPGNSVVLGKDFSGKLAKQASEIGGFHFGTWAKPFGVQGQTFSNQFFGVLNQISKTGGKIFLDLEKVNISLAKKGVGTFSEASSKNLATEWELNQILNNKDYLKNTIFHENGRVMGVEELAKKGIE